MQREDHIDMKQRVINDLLKRCKHGIPFYLAVAFVVLYADGLYRRHPDTSLIFGSTIIGICVFRMVHIAFFNWMQGISNVLNEAVFFASAAINGLVWGIAFAHFMVMDGEHGSKLLLAICTTGLCAGGVVAFIPSLRLSITFNLCMLVPAVIDMSLRKINFPLTISISLFSVYLIIVAHRGYQEYRQALVNEQALWEKSEALRLLSRTDGLTGLFNRRHFNHRFSYAWKEAIRSHSQLTILICDIDHFKRINDHHGHQAGDEFLKLTADVFREIFRRDTDIVARYGGEEFVVMLANTATVTASALAEELRQRMADICLIRQNRGIGTTLSIGIASTVPVHPEAMDNLVNSADKALYAAKQAGRNRVVMHPADDVSTIPPATLS